MLLFGIWSGSPAHEVCKYGFKIYLTIDHWWCNFNYQSLVLWRI